MKYSIIFLVEEKHTDFLKFFDIICKLFKERSVDHEILVVSNGTEDFVKSQIFTRKNYSERIKLIIFRHKVTQAICVNAALNECSGDEVLMLGSFQELSAVCYEKLIDSMTDGVDLVLPNRKSRKDPMLNRLHSKAFNKAVKILSGNEMNDIGCNTKLIKRNVLDSVTLYGNMYRYFPVLVAQKGFKIREVECEAFDRFSKTKLYSLRLYLNRSIELLNLFFSTNFSKKPLRFFNLVGTCFMLIGLMSLFYVGIERLLFNVLMGARPLLMVGIIGLVGGAQIASFGLLGEIVSFVHGRFHEEYNIEKII